VQLCGSLQALLRFAREQRRDHAGEQPSGRPAESKRDRPPPSVASSPSFDCDAMSAIERRSPG
jgi:hypothetical protein